MGAREKLAATLSPPLVNASLDWLLVATNISLAHKYIYVSTPKVACSSILQTLQRLELSDDQFLHDPPSEIHYRHLSPLLAPLQTSDFWRLVADSNYFKFCFVRNPFDRLVSCYLDKMPNPDVRQRFLGKMGRAEGDVEFEDFIQVIAGEAPIDMDPHYGIQYYQTFQDYISFDFVGRFEHLAPDLDHVSGQLGVDLRPYAARVDPHRTGRKDYAKFFTPKIAEQVRETFQLDFETFGYPFDLPNQVPRD